MEKKQRFAGADGIRGFACLIVLIAHIPGFFFPQIASYFSGTGKYGVWLFFVLSAFLLTSRFMQTGFGLTSLVSYSLGRFLRIIPIFILVLFVYWSLGYAGLLTASDLWLAATMSNGYAHLWTIPVEFKFYLILPFFAFSFVWVANRYGTYAAAGIAVMEITIHQLIWPYWFTPANSIDTRWYIPSFIFGCCAAVIIPGSRLAKDRWPTLIGCGVIILLLALSPGGRMVLLGTPPDGWLMDKFILLSFFWMLFIIALAHGNGLIGTVMRSAPLRHLGAWSYSIYLIHWLFYLSVSSIGKGWAFATIAFLLTILCGAAMFILIESPIERFRHSTQNKVLRIRMLAN